MQYSSSVHSSPAGTGFWLAVSAALIAVAVSGLHALTAPAVEHIIKALSLQ